MGEAYLEIENLSKDYPGVKALQNVSFDIRKGTLHALVGENGAGKSTLIKILAGAEKPDGGTITWRGRPYAPESPRQALDLGIATIYQVFNLLPDRTIMHNILLNKEPANRWGGIDHKAMLRTTRDILHSLGSGDLYPGSAVRNLRVGQQQIVEIAKALMNDVEFLIMDEPTAALNQAECDALFQNIQRLRQQGVTILYVSHHLDEIFRLADRVTVLRDGQLISTRDIACVDEAGLIYEMIGRQAGELNFERHAPPSAKEVLQVEHLQAGSTLKDISFSLHRGEILAVAGLSGSGKTELGKALYGDLPLDAGKITIHGKPLIPSPGRAIEQGMIYLPEDRKNDGVLQQVSIRRNVALSILPRISGRLGIIDRKQERKIAAEQTSRLHIKSASVEKEVSTLSGGNQQKVALARCLAASPDIFILMEPTQGIDIGVKFEIYQFIIEQAQNGRAILLVSSELNEIMGLAHRILVMHEGRIAACLENEATTKEEILAYSLGTHVDPVSNAACNCMTVAKPYWRL